MVNNKNILVDICWTLYKSNTTQDFIDFVATDKSYRRWRRLQRSRTVRFLLHAYVRLTGIDPWRRYAVRQLRGMPREQLTIKAEEFVSGLEQRKVEPVWQLFDNAQHIVLLSSTLDIVAQAVAGKLPREPEQVMASTLGFDGDMCTGEITSDRLTQKLTDSQAAKFRPYTIITDNISDLPLIAKSRQAYIVTYRNQWRWKRRLANMNKSNHSITFIPSNGEHY